MPLLTKKRFDFYTCSSGVSIESALSEAISLSTKKKKPIFIQFNSVMIEISSDSGLQKIIKRYNRAIKIVSKNKIGVGPITSD